MTASFLAELYKYARRPAIWVIVALWSTLLVIFGYVFPYLSYRGSFDGPGSGPDPARVLAEALPGQLVPSAVQGFPMFAGALAVIIGVLCTGSEYGWDTWKTVLTQRPPRLGVLAGKALAMAAFMLGMVVLSFTLSALGAFTVASLESKPMDWPGLGSVALGVLGGWLVVLMWCLFGIFLGVLLRGTALPIGIGLIWALAVENLVRTFGAVFDPLGELQRWLPGSNAGALIAALGVVPQGQPAGTPGVTAIVNETHASLVLLAYVLVFFAGAAYLLRRRDI